MRQAQKEVNTAENEDCNGTEAGLAGIGNDCIVVHVGGQVRSD